MRQESTKMLISIITVCYNSSNTITRTIESVLNQSYDKIEYIVIDGASNDNTVEIVNSFQNQFYEKFHRSIVILSEPDEGIYDAMNKGIRLAQGDWIGILNSDDAYVPDAANMVIQNITGAPLQVCYGGIRIYDGERLKSIIFYSHEFLEERMIAHPSCFVSRKIYDKYGVFNTRYQSAADYEFMLRLYHQKDVIFTPIYAPLTNYYLGGKSTTYAGYLDKLKMLYETGRMKRGPYLCRKIFLMVKSCFKRD